MSTNSISNFIVRDIINDSTVEIKSVNEFGIDIRIYIDVIGFRADYYAIFSLLDVKSHTADTLPSLHFFKVKDMLRSSY